MKTARQKILKSQRQVDFFRVSELRADLVSKFGGLDKARYEEDYNELERGPDEAIIKVEAVALNPLAESAEAKERM